MDINMFLVTGQQVKTVPLNSIHLLTIQDQLKIKIADKVLTVISWKMTTQNISPLISIQYAVGNMKHNIDHSSNRTRIRGGSRGQPREAWLAWNFQRELWFISFFLRETWLGVPPWNVIGNLYSTWSVIKAPFSTWKRYKWPKNRVFKLYY